MQHVLRNDRQYSFICLRHASKCAYRCATARRDKRERFLFDTSMGGSIASSAADNASAHSSTLRTACVNAHDRDIAVALRILSEASLYSNRDSVPHASVSMLLLRRRHAGERDRRNILRRVSLSIQRRWNGADRCDVSATHCSDFLCSFLHFQVCLFVHTCSSPHR